MVEFMEEQLIERKETGITILKKVGLLLLTLLVAYCIQFSSFVVYLLLIMIVVDVILFNRMKVEYEYVCFSGDFTIDKIFNKQSRKALLATNMKEVEIVMPTNAPEMRAYEHLKALNYSSCEPYNKTFTMVTMHKGNKVRVIFEPNEKILKGLRAAAPRKVIY